ncbi:MAG: hypothetical protein ABIU09_01130 [Pyrinomonadaceae bacterium]
MLTYKAMYKYVDYGVHGEVLDFPGVITCGKNLDKTRRLLAGALVDMAEVNLALGEALPTPEPSATDQEADLLEPIHLILTASSGIKAMPNRVYEAA